MSTTHYTIPQIAIDGDRLPVSGISGGKLLDRVSKVELAVVDAGTGAATTLSTNANGVLYPFACPDGAMVAVVDFNGAQTLIFADETLALLSDYQTMRVDTDTALDRATQALSAVQVSGGISGKYAAPVVQNTDGSWPARPDASTAYPLLIPRNPSQPVVLPSWWTSDLSMMTILTVTAGSTTPPPDGGGGGTTPPPSVTPTLAATATEVSATSARLAWSTNQTPAAGWTVSRDGEDASGYGAWSTTIGNGSAREHVFQALRSSFTYNLTVGCVASNGQTITSSASHRTPTVTGRMSTSITASGSTSDYHLYTSNLTANLKGLVVYFDGDGMYGHLNPNSTWALGGTGGVPRMAASRGWATLSIQTPDRSGERTWWESGTANAAFAAAVIQQIRAELGVTKTWLVGYSGGSQLITKFLIPNHSGILTAGGGAVITGGGGAPTTSPTIDPTLKAVFPMHWVTGSADDGTGTSDGYNALADAKSGRSWYATRGYLTSYDWRAGWDHDSLGTQFGTLLAAQLDKTA